MPKSKTKSASLMAGFRLHLSLDFFDIAWACLLAIQFAISIIRKKSIYSFAVVSPAPVSLRAKMCFA